MASDTENQRMGHVALEHKCINYVSLKTLLKSMSHFSNGRESESEKILMLSNRKWNQNFDSQK